MSLWRQVEEALIEEIKSGKFEAEQRLPASDVLAQRFGVNRHTILKAVSHMQAEGYVRVERGRGTFVVVNRLAFRLGERRWFEQNLLESQRVPRRTIVSIEEIKPDKTIAAALGVTRKDPVLFMKLLGEADDLPVNFGYNYFPLSRFPEIENAFRDIGTEPTERLSFSDVFETVGIRDWRRKSIRIRSRLPSDEEAWQLRIASTEHVLETEVTSVLADDVPLIYAKTGYSSSRVELVMEL